MAGPGPALGRRRAETMPGGRPAPVRRCPGPWPRPVPDTRCRRGTGKLSGLRRAGEEEKGDSWGLRGAGAERQKWRGALLEGAGDGEAAAGLGVGREPGPSLLCWRGLRLEEEAGGHSWGGISLRELSFISSSGRSFKEHHMSLSVRELCKHLEGWESLQLISTAPLASFTPAGHPQNCPSTHKLARGLPFSLLPLSAL